MGISEDIICIVVQSIVGSTLVVHHSIYVLRYNNIQGRTTSLIIKYFGGYYYF